MMRSILKGGSWRSRVVPLCLASACSLAAVGMRRGDAAATKADGLRLYKIHCASCHGTSGGGDGPDAVVFSPRPPDLRPILQRYTTEELVRRVRDGRQLNLQFEPQMLRSQALTVEGLTAYLRRLPLTNWRLADKGQELYVQRCEDCHGPRGRPSASAAGTMSPPDLSDSAFQASIGDAELIDLVRHGRKGMPALIPRVSEGDGRALASFVRLFSPGFDTYSRYCANCHGEDGRGRGSLGEVVHPPMVVFDRVYFKRCDADCLRLAVWHMATEHQPHMPHYRDVLSVPQTRAIVTYLRGQALGGRP